jgi:glycosyltransferase involved in cell wall biosynthesis
MVQLNNMGVIVIGRNEGERLKASLRSLIDVPHRVYVDSGSTDDSLAVARELGFETVQLRIPPGFTAARARNAGLERLLSLNPGLELVQMVDGDCEVASGWLGAAAAALARDKETAVVFGRRRERHPEASVYNMLCDVEWDVPVGEAKSCGGDALFRVEALVAAGGYSDGLIAGEEPDLCLRLRAQGWKIRRIDAEMTLHDAAMTRLSQWWNRSRRAGHAFAELVYRHGKDSDPHWTRQVASIAAWGGVGIIAALFAVAAPLFGSWVLAGAAALLLLLFAAQVARLTLIGRRRGEPVGKAFAWAAFLMLGKFPQLQGVALFHKRRLTGARSKLIEYKN